MKNLLSTLALTLITSSLFAQYNQFRDDETNRDKQRQNMAQHHVKQVTWYTSAGADTSAKSASQRSIVNYDMQGRVTQILYPHAISSDKPEQPAVVYTYNNQGKLVSEDKRFFYNMLKTYTYNAKSQLTAETYITNIPADNTYGYHNYTINNTYNKKGNVVEQTKYGPDNTVLYTKHFKYDRHNATKKCITQFADGSVTRDKYQYKVSKGLLTKIVSTYKNDSLITVNRYIYDEHLNQITGYETKNGLTRTVWNYSYNSDGQPTISTGGPGEIEGLNDLDFRKDGLVPISYTYDADGLLTQLSKVNYFPNMHKTITSFQKLAYIKY